MIAPRPESVVCGPPFHLALDSEEWEDRTQAAPQKRGAPHSYYSGWIEGDRARPPLRARPRAQVHSRPSP